MAERFPEQSIKFAPMPVLSGDVATDRWIWNLAQVLAEIARNNTEEGSDDEVQ